jgi:iron(III) transport system substrate-binding protein
MNGNDGHDSRRAVGRRSRRAVLRAGGVLGASALAGCNVLAPGEQSTPTGGGDGDEPELIGSGREGRALPGGTPMSELPDLSGDLTVYSGRGEFLVGQLMQFIRERYPELTLEVRYGSAADLANQVRTEGQATPADVFFTVNAGILGLLASEGRLQSLPDAVLGMGREGYQDPQGRWIGTSGRIRAVPYNTDALDASDVPGKVLEFPDTERLRDDVGWAPTYSSFQGFVTVMRILEGEERTRQWLQGMLELGVQEYSDEFRVAQAVADGEISAGLTNHYYIVRVLDGRPDAPLAMGFTESDAGSFFNVAGAGVVDASDRAETAATFVRHLLSAEAQDYFARSATFEYPMIPEVEPIDRLPAFSELNPPDLDLAEFAQADVTETIDLMEEAGVL